MARKLIFAGGIVHLAFVVFHIALPRLLGWSTTLQALTPDDRGTVYTLNIAVASMLLVLAVVSLLHRDALLSTPLGNMVCGGIALFWVIRAASEFIFYPAPSLVLAVVCVAIAALYLVPLLTIGSRRQDTQLQAS
jgi:NADH:ubiquinone oxidoreductase subunit 3 (subunit A)